jgi:hypothetical protein
MCRRPLEAQVHFMIYNHHVTTRPSDDRGISEDSILIAPSYRLRHGLGGPGTDVNRS